MLGLSRVRSAIDRSDHGRRHFRVSAVTDHAALRDTALEAEAMLMRVRDRLAA